MVLSQMADRKHVDSQYCTQQGPGLLTAGAYLVHAKQLLEVHLDLQAADCQPAAHDQEKGQAAVGHTAHTGVNLGHLAEAILDLHETLVQTALDHDVGQAVAAGVIVEEPDEVHGDPQAVVVHPVHG